MYEIYTHKTKLSIASKSEQDACKRASRISETMGKVTVSFRSNNIIELEEITFIGGMEVA